MNPLTPLQSTESNPFHKIIVVDGYKVDEVKTKEKNKNIQDIGVMPEHPFLLAYVAPRKSGKTNAMVDSLLDKNKFRGKFDEIIIWSKTFYLDPKWQRLKIEKECVHTEWNAREAQLVIDELTEDAEERMKENKPKRQVLVIFDDMLDSNIMNKHHAGPMESIAARGRHSGISCIIVYQELRCISPVVRTNITNLVIFRIKNALELKKICDENRETLTPEQWMQIYEFATGEKFCFLHINNQESDPDFRFRKNWNTIIRLDRNKATDPLRQ